MAHDVAVERQRRAILRQLQLYNEGPDWFMVSPTKARQVRSIARGRLATKDLVLPEAPIRSTNNPRTGKSSVTYRNGRTVTYTPVKP
jgi:hypothetical protein